MSTHDEPSTDPPLTREELVALVERAHQGFAYGEAALAGRKLAAQSRLPKAIAENLGAAFGQWDFFPEAAEIVDFACAYVPPRTEEEIWAMARAWASDDAAGRPTLIALVGREILQHELYRIEVPTLRALFDEARPAHALAMRASLGLEVPAALPPKAQKAQRAKSKRKTSGAASVKREHEGTTVARMPKPAFVRAAKAAPAPPVRRLFHPTFGEGVLESQDGVGPEAKLTIKFESGSKILLARYVTEVPP
jgi:hypothetical protein